MTRRIVLLFLLSGICVSVNSFTQERGNIYGLQFEDIGGDNNYENKNTPQKKNYQKIGRTWNNPLQEQSDGPIYDQHGNGKSSEPIDGDYDYGSTGDQKDYESNYGEIKQKPRYYGGYHKYFKPEDKSEFRPEPKVESRNWKVDQREKELLVNPIAKPFVKPIPNWEPNFLPEVTIGKSGPKRKIAVIERRGTYIKIGPQGRPQRVERNEKFNIYSCAEKNNYYQPLPPPPPPFYPRFS